MMFCPSSLIILRKCPPRALTTLWQLSQSKDRGWALQQGNIYWKDSLKQLSQWKSWLPLALVDSFAWEEGNLWLYSVGLQQSHLPLVVPFKCKYLKLLWSYNCYLAKKQLDISAPAPLSVRSQNPGLDLLPGFLMLTPREPAGCCALVGHVLILGQGQPWVFILLEGIVQFLS